jgi:disulfide bond formation protein DsbB
VRPRTVSLLLIVAAAAPLAVALLAQYVGHLPPCELCLLQRLPYDAALALAVASLALARRPGLLRAAVSLVGIAFLASAALAAFHVGVEQQWWEWASACTGSVSGQGKTAAEIEAMLMAAPVVRCDEVSWSLFGISIAGFNVLYGVAAGAVALWLAARAPWQRPPVA